MHHFCLLPACLALAAGSLACSSPSAPACTPTGLELAFDGTLTIASGTQQITLHGEYSAGVISHTRFDYLVDVLYMGQPTGGASAVFEVFGSPLSITLLFELGGGRAAGSVLPLLGLLSQGLPAGQGPVLSAVVPNGFFVLFGNDTYRATTGTGTWMVSRAAPLAGHLTFQFGDAQGQPAALDGQLMVSGVGCP